MDQERRRPHSSLYEIIVAIAAIMAAIAALAEAILKILGWGATV